MYRDLVYAAWAWSPPTPSKYFKDASFGVPRPGQEERTYSPRAGVIVVRDKGFRRTARLRQHSARTRCSGRGYVGAEDRLLPSWTSCAMLAAASCPALPAAPTKPWTATSVSSLALLESDLQKQIDQLDNLYGASEGAALQQDVNDYRRGR